MLSHGFISLGFLSDWQSIVGEAERETVFERLRRALDSHAERQGELHLTVPIAYLEARVI